MEIYIKAYRWIFPKMPSEVFYECSKDLELIEKLCREDIMTEKKFTVYIKWFNYEKTEGEIELFDNGQPLLVSECIEDVQWIKSLLNELHEEKEQLKQFKEDVFAKIDMHLRMLPTARDKEFNEDDGDPSLYTGAIYMLETLKKELEE